MWFIETKNDNSLAVNLMIMISALPSHYENITKHTKQRTLGWNVVTHWSDFVSQANTLVLRLFVIHHSHKFNNTPVPYSTMHYSEQKCAHFCSEWCIVGYGALWDLWDWSITVQLRYPLFDGASSSMQFLYQATVELISFSWYSIVLFGL